MLLSSLNFSFVHCLHVVVFTIAHCLSQVLVTWTVSSCQMNLLLSGSTCSNAIFDIPCTASYLKRQTVLALWTSIYSVQWTLYVGRNEEADVVKIIMPVIVEEKLDISFFIFMQRNNEKLHTSMLMDSRLKRKWEQKYHYKRNTCHLNRKKRL